MIVTFVIMWASMVISLILIYKDFKKRESVSIFKIELLESEVEMLKVEKDDLSVSKMNQLASELLDVIQSKEDDIKELLKMVEGRASENRKTEISSFVEGDSYEENIFKNDISCSELHTINVLKRRRAS